MMKILSLVLALAMMLSLCSFASAEGFSGEVKVWVAEATVEFTKAQVELFKAAHPEYANMTVTVQPVGEGDAASNMLTDVEAGADLYVFAQDQLARLVAAGALEVVLDENAEIVKAHTVTYPRKRRKFTKEIKGGLAKLQRLLQAKFKSVAVEKLLNTHCNPS